MHWIAVVSALMVKSAATPCILPSVQKPAAASAVTVSGDVSEPLTIDNANSVRFAPLKADITQPSDSGSIQGEFEGISLVDVLKKSGARSLKSKSGFIDSFITARASDGYEVVLSYSELDRRLSIKTAFLAFHCNGFLITPTIVVPGDLTSARYVHEVSTITFRVPR